MSFGLPLALLLALGVGLVVIAHALRRGAALVQIFPGAHLLEAKTVTAKKRSRLEDRALLSLRALMVLALALLAASPAVSCSRFSLTRSDGASVAAVIVLDDSASMAAKLGDDSRFEVARQTSVRLVRDMRGGDTTAVVLAGRPARVLVSPTLDQRGALDALENLAVTERATDLEGAMALARTLLQSTPQADRRIVLMSDLSSTTLPEEALSDVVVPELGLTEPLSNCAVVQATHQGKGVAVELACTDEKALQGRTVSLHNERGERIGAERPADSTVLVLPLPDRTQPNRDRSEALPADRVRLSPGDQDQIPSDDESFILLAEAELMVGVRADASKAGLKTGTATVLQSGLEALQRGIVVTPLSLLPDDDAEFDRLAALLIDDPSGLQPEIRDALERWVQAGGVAAAFLGPGVERAPLGSQFSPFSHHPPRWVPQDASGAPVNRAGALGPLTTTWNDLGASHRAEFGLAPEVRRLAEWTDGAPLVTSERKGQGLVVTSSLPVSVDLSDFALRPAYLELLDWIVTEAALRRGATAVEVGTTLQVGANAQVMGPDGRVRPVSLEEADDDRGAVFSPDRSGSYRIEEGTEVTQRFALRIPEEHISQPQTFSLDSQEQGGRRSTTDVPVARHVALALLILSFLELAWRLVGRGLPRRGLSTKVLPS